MKELSIEEKAKAYDEALKAAVIAYKDEDKHLKATLERIFPQLKESEDEIIRKKLISYFSAVKGFSTLEYNYVISNEEVIAWLEKQGKQRLKKISLWKHWKNGIAGNGEGKLVYLIKSGNSYTLSSCLGYECDYIELSDLDELMLSEKQVDQKPIIFIPKFRVGDRLISTKNPHLTYEILEVGHINELGNPEYKVIIFADGKGKSPQDVHYLECQKVDEWGEFMGYTPADKVKPIFNIGDTIVERDLDECGYGTIKDIKNGQYVFTDGSGLSINEQEGWQIVKNSRNYEEE